MEDQQQQQALHSPPHVLIFPLPLQGPVNSMLKLGELLCLSGLHVTFLVTDHIRSRLVRFTNIQSHFSRYPGFHLDSISDGLPEDHPRLGDQLMEMFDAFEAVTKPLFRQMLLLPASAIAPRPAVTFIIADGILSFTIDVAKEIGLPIVCCRTISPCSLWLFFCLPILLQSAEFPFQVSVLGKSDINETMIIVADLPAEDAQNVRADLSTGSVVKDKIVEAKLSDADYSSGVSQRADIGTKVDIPIEKPLKADTDVFSLSVQDDLLIQDRQVSITKDSKDMLEKRRAGAAFSKCLSTNKHTISGGKIRGANVQCTY